MSTNKSLSITIKGLVVGFLILLLMIPALLVGNLISERADRQREVAGEISSKWAEEQTVLGPVLVIPYNSYKSETISDASGKVSTVTRMEEKLCYILPEELLVDGELMPQTRKRSIFKITVYQAALGISGKFAPIDFRELDIAPADLHADRAQVCFGLSDFRGIEKQIDIEWNGEKLPLTTGMVRNDLIETGLAANITLDPAAGHAFSMSIEIRGSEEFSIYPLGKTTEVKLSSPYANPSFTGNFLPNTPAEISEGGFAAEWKVLNLNRNYPQSWKDDSYDVYDSWFGVELLQPGDTYTKTTKAVKYAILFIALTFVLCFLLEIIQKRNVHPLQYVLVGLALCLFYTLLLSISEYLGFNWAYLISAAAIVGLVSWYSWDVFKKRTIAIAFGCVLGVLYTFIFILLQLQDGALLAGSIGLFVLLAAIMYYTRKVDWQNERAQDA